MSATLPDPPSACAHVPPRAAAGSVRTRPRAPISEDRIRNAAGGQLRFAELPLFVVDEAHGTSS
jgi:hypothetical protein